MKCGIGHCVELVGLQSSFHHNNKRGLIFAKDKDRWKVELTTGEIVMAKIKNLAKVYCLGIPNECRHSSEFLDPSLLRMVLQNIDSRKFYIFVQKTTGVVFIQVNVQFFKMAVDKMTTTDHLLRIYTTSISQNDLNAKIIFEERCIHVTEDLSKPWFVDLSHHKLHELIDRFNSEKDEKELKAMNIHDMLLLFTDC